jgi:hypothetical protein
MKLSRLQTAARRPAAPLVPNATDVPVGTRSPVRVPIALCSLRRSLPSVRA